MTAEKKYQGLKTVLIFYQTKCRRHIYLNSMLRCLIGESKNCYKLTSTHSFDPLDYMRFVIITKNSIFECSLCTTYV